MAEPMTELPEALYTQLQKETFVLLHTVDHETGSPTSSAISWLYAVSPTKLRVAIDQRSRLNDNIAAQPQVAVTLFGSGVVYAVSGKANKLVDRLEEVPIKLCCYDIDIEFVRDAMFYGARLTHEPEYEKTYDQRAAAKLDNQVFTAMRKL